ncbi:MAG: hypothetical protein Q8R43_00290, partial [Alphaproteobacteria bacterium]|nr:hypothetical protein [Alphaproteobacteria bacterium]
MNMTQTLNNFFAKKTKPQAQINSQTDGAAVERAAVLDLSSKTMSRIASFTLFCFLSQTFASILWANPILPRQHHFHENGYVGLHIVPEFDAANQVRGMRLNISVSDRLYATQTQQNQNNIEDSYTQESKLSVKEVCSTLLTPDFFRGEKSLLSQLPQMNVEIAGIVDDSLKDLFLITTETGDLSITSKGNAKTNRNLYISIMGGVTVQNLRAHGICVQARSLEIRGAGNDITHLDYIKPAGAAEAVMTLQEEGQLQVQHMRLHKTTFNNYGTAIVERMTGNQAVLNNHDVLEGALTGHFSALNNLGIEATYNGKLTANVVTVHNENVMTLLAGSHLRGRTLHIDHKNARFNAQDAHINVTEITNKGHLVLEGASKLSVKTLTNQKGATLTAAGTYKIGTFVNKAVSQKQVGALFSGDGEFDSIDNAGSLETQGVTKIHRRMNDNNTVCGFTNRSGARAKLTKLQVGYGDTHWIINNGYLDLVDVDEHYGPKHLKNNSGATLLVRGGYFTTLENEGRVEVHQLSDFITIRNLAKKDGKKIPVMLFKAEVVTNTLTNAGELYALAYLTYTKKFTNNEGAKARIQGLAYEPASEEITSAYDLENAGALDLTQVDQGYAPKRVQNTVTGSLALHDNQGEWDHAVFKDI